jgi:hypothetical protein
MRLGVLGRPPGFLPVLPALFSAPANHSPVGFLASSASLDTMLLEFSPHDAQAQAHALGAASCGFDFAHPPPCDHKVPGLAFGAAGLEKIGP